MIPVARAHKRTWNPKSQTWNLESSGQFEIAKGYFARGAQRIAFRLNEIDSEGRKTPLVAKFMDVDTLMPLVGPITRDMYFSDAKSQVVACSLAAKFNKGRPPKKVEVLPVFVLEFPDWNALCLVEPELTGTYDKHNNNNGDVLSRSQTPQAFSHFTYEATRGDLVVVDVQGVGETYTDPQIHSTTGKGYGLGNQGRAGIKKFLATHSCNGVCLTLGLPRLVNGTKAKPWPKKLVEKLRQTHQAPVHKPVPVPSNPAEEDNQVVTAESIVTAMRVNVIGLARTSIHPTSPSNSSSCACSRSATVTVIPSPRHEPDVAVSEQAEDPKDKKMHSRKENIKPANHKPSNLDSKRRRHRVRLYAPMGEAMAPLFGRRRSFSAGPLPRRRFGLPIC